MCGAIWRPALAAVALLAGAAHAQQPVQGVTGCPATGPAYTSSCVTLPNTGTVSRDRGAINERGCHVFGKRPGALRAVNRPAVFYGTSACPARAPDPPDSPGVKSPFRKRLEYTLIYAGKVYSWPGSEGTRTTDW